MARRQVQIHNNPTLFHKKVYSGSQVSNLDIQNGARLVFTLYVYSIDPGAEVEITIEDSFSEAMPFANILSISSNQVGHVKRILSDFHNFMDVTLNVIGGNAEVIIGVSLYDNASKSGSYPVDDDGVLVTNPKGLVLGKDYDDLLITYPTATTEQYFYIKETINILTVEVTYSDSTKENIIRVQVI